MTESGENRKDLLLRRVNGDRPEEGSELCGHLWKSFPFLARQQQKQRPWVGSCLSDRDVKEARVAEQKGHRV